MSDSLVRLLKIRELRELVAGTHVYQCQVQLQTCLQRQQQQKDQCDRYRYWRLNREKALFKTLQNKPVRSRELECYRAELAALQERENGLATELRQTDQAVENADQALIEARLNLRKTTKAKEKLLVHLSICASDAKYYQENQEEQEQEDFNLCSECFFE